MSDHALEAGGEHGADWFLAVGGELIDDPLYAGCSGGGVESAEDQVAGFRGLDGDMGRFQVTHLAH